MIAFPGSGRTELTKTISGAGTLAGKLTETVKAVNRVVSRFDLDPKDGEVPPRMADVRDAAIETGRAADRLTLLLQQPLELLESGSRDRRISSVTEPATTILDRVFWRGVILVCLLVGGFGLLRFVPQRVK